MSEPLTIRDLRVYRRHCSDEVFPHCPGHDLDVLTPDEFDALARAWAVENGWVERTEARRWVDGMAEVADRYKRERDIARYHQETTERSYKRQIEYMRENGWVEPKACGECEGSGGITNPDDPDGPVVGSGVIPCPSCGGTGTQPGSIPLRDGREIRIVAEEDTNG